VLSLSTTRVPQQDQRLYCATGKAYSLDTMTFAESIRTVFRKYADFTGRATQPEFWWFVLFSSLVSAALSALSAPANGRLFEFTAEANSVSAFVSLASVWSIAVLVPSLAVTVRRLRDTDREWTQLLWLLLPIVGLIILIVQLAEPSKVPAQQPAPGEH
jgi:uncharacterized membrane protein YhaH (DUF805 family)